MRYAVVFTLAVVAITAYVLFGIWAAEALVGEGWVLYVILFVWVMAPFWVGIVLGLRA